MNIIKITVAAAAISAMGAGWAADELDRLAEGTERARAELAYIQTQQELEEARKRLESSRASGFPRLIAIEGGRGRLTAQVVTSNGASWQVVAGDTYAPGWRVAEVMADRVIVTPAQGGARYQVGLGEAQPVRVNGASR